MKNKIIVISLFFVTSLTIKAQWAPINGTFGNQVINTMSINRIEFLNGKIISGIGNNNIYAQNYNASRCCNYSNDNGNDWNSNNIENNGNNILQFSGIEGENLLFSNAKLYSLKKYQDQQGNYSKTLYSSNDGINFTILNNVNLPNAYNYNNELIKSSITECKLLKVDNNTIYVGTKYYKNNFSSFDSYRVYKSIDNGLNWSFFITTSYGVIDIIFNNSVTYVIDAAWVYKSINNGATWTSSRPSTVSGGINCAVLKGNDIYIGTGSWGSAPTGQGIAKSADGGISWTFVNNGLIPFLTKQLFVLGSNLLAVTSNYNDSIGYVFLSSDEGLNWQEISSSELRAKCPVRLNADNNFLYCGTKSNGLWRVAINSLSIDSFDMEYLKSTIAVYWICK